MGDFDSLCGDIHSFWREGFIVAYRVRIHTSQLHTGGSLCLWLTFNTTFDLPREYVYGTKTENILEPCNAIAIMAMSTPGPCTLIKDITQWVASGSQDQPDPNPATRSLRVGHDWTYSHPPRMMQRVAPRRFWSMMEGHLRRVASSPTPSRKLLSTQPRD